MILKHYSTFPSRSNFSPNSSLIPIFWEHGVLDSERFLAFEILCTYIEDFDVRLTEQESREISFIDKEFEIESTSD
nr:MafI family immunity protein [Neisseria lactamica]